MNVLGWHVQATEPSCANAFTSGLNPCANLDIVEALHLNLTGDSSRRHPAPAFNLLQGRVQGHHVHVEHQPCHLSPVLQLSRQCWTLSSTLMLT